MIGGVPDIERILRQLESTEDYDPNLHQRRAKRRPWRKRFRVWITQPGGDRRRIEVVTRDLSSGGLSFVTPGYVHVGTRCEFQLITTDNAWVDVRGVVVRCRYVAGRLHEVGVRFEQSVEDSQFIARTLHSRILLVDDAEDLARLTASFLRSVGAEVQSVGSGAAAMQLLTQQDFDLILLEVEAPGVDVDEVLRASRRRTPPVPTLVYTVSDDPGVRERCLRAGCCDVLTKPLSKSQLLDAVTRYRSTGPCILSRYAGNPEMEDFVREFVQRLPVRVDVMRHCLVRRQGEKLCAMARHLKVAASDAGGCGFQSLSDAAQGLVTALTAQPLDWTAAEAAFRALEKLASRVRASGP